MRDNDQKAGKNRIMTLTIVMLCLLAIAIGLYKSIAAYITVSNMKAVASTNENEDLFNSNYLYGYRSSGFSLETRSIELNPTDGQETVTFELKIFNHNKEDINIINPNTVKYNLTIEVNAPNGADKYTISNTTKNGSTFTHEGATLQGRTANSHSYLITMPSSDLGKVSLNVKAIVDRTGGNAGTDLFALAARLEPCRNASVASPSVEGRLVDSGNNNNIGDYAAFNYEVTVGGSKSKIKLEWNKDYVEIDPFFATKHGYVDNERKPLNTGVLEYEADVGTEVIQFYRINGLSEPSDWGDDGNLGFKVTKASS